jgi:hypothetical protein
MKTNVIISTVLSIFILATSVAFGQDKKVEKAQKTAVKTFINGTPAFIKEAVALKKESKREDGEPYIAKASDHYKHAVELYKAENLEKAIYHTLKARKYLAQSMKLDKGKYVEDTDVNTLFQNFKDPKDKENKDFYKNIKIVFKNTKDAALGEFESELDGDLEVTEDDSKVDVKGLEKVK